MKLSSFLLTVAVLLPCIPVQSTSTTTASAEEVSGCDYQPPRYSKTVLSKSGRMVLQFGPAEGSPYFVSVRSTSEGAESQSIFFQDNGTYVDADISDDDRLIVVSWGSASYGAHLEIFERSKSGKFKQHKVDLTDRAWVLIRKALKLRPSDSANHSYSKTVKLHSEPLSFVFRVGGDYARNEKTYFGPFYFRYLVESKKLELVPEPEHIE